MVNPLDFLRSAKKKQDPDAAATETPVAEASDAVLSPEPAADAAAVTAEPSDLTDAAAVVDPPEEKKEVTSKRCKPTAPEALYAECLKVVVAFFKAAAKLDSDEAEELPIADVEAVAFQLVEAMIDGDKLVALAVGPYPDSERFIVPHSVNVAILAQRVGRHMELGGGGASAAGRRRPGARCRHSPYPEGSLLQGRQSLRRRVGADQGLTASQPRDRSRNRPRVPRGGRDCLSSA